MSDLNIISDSSPVIALIKKGELSLLKNLFKKIVIPQGVYEELTDNPEYQEEQRKQFQDEYKLGWITIKQLETLKYPDLPLGKGETEAINACLEIENVLLLIDEKKGRTMAKSLNIRVIGTLGILALTKKKDLKTAQELETNLEKLIQQGFYLSSDIILRFLKNLRS